MGRMETGVCGHLARPVHVPCSGMSRGEKEGEKVPSRAKDIPPALRIPLACKRGRGAKVGGAYLPHADWAVLLRGPCSSQMGGRGPSSCVPPLRSVCVMFLEVSTAPIQ